MATNLHPKNQVNPGVFDEDLWLWIEKNQSASTVELRLKYGFTEPYNSAIAQIEAKQKYASKFKSLFEERWIFPKGVALEQSSSLATANFKSTLFATPYSADLCAGMGIDSLAISLRDNCERHLCFEQNKELAKLLAYNLKQTDVIAESFETEALKKWVEENDIRQHQLTVYLDPDRRAHSTRTHLIEQGTPNLLINQNELLTLACTVITKHSPMMDIHDCQKKLIGLHSIYTVQHQGECKEVLTVQKTQYNATPNLIAIEAFSGQRIEHPYPAQYSVSNRDVSCYLIQPSAGLNKSELHDYLARENGWSRLGFGNLFTCENLPKLNPFYKVFEVKSTFTSVKNLKLSGAFAIESVGSKISADELRKRLKLKEGRANKLFYLQKGRTKLIVHGHLIE